LDRNRDDGGDADRQHEQENPTFHDDTTPIIDGANVEPASPEEMMEEGARAKST
jgi:hypothetical protein